MEDLINDLTNEITEEITQIPEIKNIIQQNEPEKKSNSSDSEDIYSNLSNIR